MDGKYGLPENLGVFDLDFTEYMHYMYLPIITPESRGKGWDETLPERLAFAAPVIEEALAEEYGNEKTIWKYVYVTARRGFATPGNPLNRPGWHADGFGTEDVNYVWTDLFPTLYANQDFHGISKNHIESIRQFEEQVDPEKVVEFPEKSLLRLTSKVVHSAPEIPPPGGERSFLKVSFSNSRYNLKGNSHNYLIDYNWKMYDRQEVRNDPNYAGGDTAGEK